MINKGRMGSRRGVTLLGVDLQDAREEMFVRMVCDGLSIGVAFFRAGFTSKHKNAAYNLFHLPRVQARAAAILEARRSTGVVTLGEVTDMLQRVFAGAHSEGEYSAAHNAAFSLARLYGHVTDKATLEVIRRPSRDPDAPSEQALASWVESLPALPGPGPAASPQASPPSPGAFFNALANPLEPQAEAQPQNPNEINDLAGPGPAAALRQPPPGPESEREKLNDINWLGASGPGPSGPEREFYNEIKGLGPDGIEAPGRPENGAPSLAVTMTPQPSGHSAPLGPQQSGRSNLLKLQDKGGPGPTPTKKKRVPRRKPRVPLKIREQRKALKQRREALLKKRRAVKPGVSLPSAKDLFG